MNTTLWNKRIPTLLGLFLLTLGAGVTSWLVNTGMTLSSHASISTEPHDFRITNITDASFTISYTTTEPTTGTISYSKDTSLGEVAIDTRDTQQQQPHQIHYFTLSNLQPSTQYYFTILSGSTTYLHNNEAFTITTAPHLPTDPPNQPPISGQLTLPSGQPPHEAVVYLTNDYAHPLSTLVQADGSYSFQTSLLRTSDLSAYFPAKDTVPFKILAMGDGLESQSTILSTQANPVPVMMLSAKQYDFTVTPESETTTEGTPNRFPTLSGGKQTTPSTFRQVQITSPQNGAILTEQVFTGRGMPNQYVDITITPPSDLTARVLVNKQGLWTYRPKSSLAPGQHTITITSKDTTGQITTSRTFIIPTPTVSPTP